MHRGEFERFKKIHAVSHKCNTKMHRQLNRSPEMQGPAPAHLFRLFRPLVSLRRLWPSALARVEWESAPGIGPDLG